MLTGSKTTITSTRPPGTRRNQEKMRMSEGWGVTNGGSGWVTCVRIARDKIRCYGKVFGMLGLS
jgi:hypothetical protein